MPYSEDLERLGYKDNELDEQDHEDGGDATLNLPKASGTEKRKKITDETLSQQPGKTVATKNVE